MKITFQKEYHGLASQPISWSALEEIFNIIWGKEYHTLPKYPKIIGRVDVRWNDRFGNNIEAEALDDLKQAYTKKETGKIHLSGNPDNTPSCLIIYTPSQQEIQATIQKEDEAKTEDILRVIKKHFPKAVKNPYWLNNKIFWYPKNRELIPVIFDTNRKSKNDETNSMLYIFTILYEQYIKDERDVSDVAMRQRLIKDFHLNSDTVNRSDFLKTTVGHIRRKFESRGLEDFVLIKRERGLGYKLDIKNP